MRVRSTLSRGILAKATDRSMSRQRVGRIRRGSVMGMMAILLPVLAILSAFCINAAHMQLTRTELIVATDAAAKAGGRAFSDLQSVDAAKAAAISTAAMNTVDGDPLQLDGSEGSGQIVFGYTTQPDGPEGRYVFEPLPTSVVEKRRHLR